MRKLKLLIGGVLSATLLLGACGTDESKQDAKQENKKEQVTKDKQNKEKTKAYKQNEKIKKQKQKAYQTRIAEEEQQNTQQDQTQVEQPPVQEAPVEQPQEVENPARDQVVNEGIDMDNPTDAEIERMRELAKDSPHGLQTAPSQGGY